MSVKCRNIILVRETMAFLRMEAALWEVPKALRCLLFLPAHVLKFCLHGNQRIGGVRQKGMAYAWAVSQKKV